MLVFMNYSCTVTIDSVVWYGMVWYGMEFGSREH